jgi:hypothetical protein
VASINLSGINIMCICRDNIKEGEEHTDKDDIQIAEAPVVRFIVLDPCFYHYESFNTYTI